MIGLDTNVILRYLMQDDPKQSKQAYKIMEEEVSETAPAFISSVVLVETCWTLKIFYEIDREGIIQMVDQFLVTSELHLEHREEVWQAVQQSKNGTIDFVDALVGAIGKSQGCEFIYTFDKKAAKSRFFKKL